MNGETKTDRCPVVEHVEAVVTEAEHLGEALGHLSQMIEAVCKLLESGLAQTGTSGLGEAISAVVLVMVSSKEQLQGFMESSHFSTS